MCKYCDEDRLDWLDKNDTVGVALESDPWMLLVFRMTDDDGVLTYDESIGGAEINFCPKCGRRLPN